MMRSTPALVAAALVFGTGVAVHAKDELPPATAEIVRVDAVVTDAQGKPVKDLKPQDFDVREDGKRQRVTGFAFMGETSAAASAPVEAAAATAQPPAGGVGEGLAKPPRYVAIVIDELHLSQRSIVATREVLQRFLTETVRPEDEVAFVVVGSQDAIIQPTRDRAVLEQALGRINPRRDLIVTGQGAQLTPEQAEQILRGDQSSLRLATQLMVDEPGSAFAGAMVPRNTSSDPTPIGVDPSQKAAALDSQRQARGILAEALSVSEVTLRTLESVVRGMGVLPGRKLCLLVSDGFLLGRGTSEERLQDLRQVIDGATRSGTAIYPLVPGTVRAIGADASTVGSAGPAGLRDRVARASEKIRVETLEGLADDTGGFLIKGADAVETGLAHMLGDSAATYLLSYVPTNQKHNGRFRKISVRLPGHPDYVIRSRQGYFAPDKKRAQQARRSVGPRTLTRLEAQMALQGPFPKAGVPVRIAADFREFPAPEGAQAIVKAHLDAAGLGWKKVDGREQTEFDLVGGVYDTEGKPTGPPFAGQHYAYDSPPEEYAALQKTGVRFETTVPLKPGRYEIRMLALDAAHAPIGGARQSIEIPDLATKQLTLSDVFLSSAATAKGAAVSVRDAQVLRRFERSDTLVFQVYVYNVSKDAAGESDVVLQAQVRSEGKPPFASKPRPALLRTLDGALLPESDGLPLAGLAPGDYVLRIVVVDRKAKATAFRDVGFTVTE